jgi:hypothetical protein
VQLTGKSAMKNETKPNFLASDDKGWF